MRILLSIKPEFVKKIFDGTKQYEYRKTIFKRTNIRTVVVYSTSPVGQIVGEFDIEEVIRDHPSKLWHATKHAAGIDAAFFDDYFDGREQAIAIKIGALRLYETPLNPKEVFDDFVPPQSFCYLDGGFIDSEGNPPLLPPSRRSDCSPRPKDARESETAEQMRA